jgi:hypothetical protein
MRDGSGKPWNREPVSRLFFELYIPAVVMRILRKFIVCQHIDVEICSRSDILSDSLRESIDTANPSSFSPS